MLWGQRASARTQALIERVDKLSDQLDRATSQVGHAFSNIDRLSSDLKALRERMDTVVADRRGQASQFSALREVITQLQAYSRTLADQVSALRGGQENATEVMTAMRDRSDRLVAALDDQALRLDTLQGWSMQQERSLDQVCADVTRIERQAAADLAELRTTNTALARVMLKASPERAEAGRPEGLRRSGSRADASAHPRPERPTN